MSWSPRAKDVRRDWGSDETGCTILHVDMDAFFASLETARHPEVAGRPVIVGMPAKMRGVVSTANYEARKYGVHSAMPMATAVRLCPHGCYFTVDHAYYSAISRQIFGGLLASITDRIEQVSVDEAYADVSGALLRWKRPTAIGAYIRQEVARRWHITCSVGIASNMLIAKLASTNAKPDGMLMIPRSRNAEFMSMLPLGAINGIGPALQGKLSADGITSVDQLRQAGREELTEVTGSASVANWLYLAARGESERRIVTHAPMKSISAERTLLRDTRDLATVERLLHRCCDEVAARLRKSGLLARTVTLKLRYSDLTYSTRSQTLEVPMQDASLIYPVVRGLLLRLAGARDETDEARREIRLAGVGVSGLLDQKRTLIQPQLDLGEEDGTPARGIGQSAVRPQEGGIRTAAGKLSHAASSEGSASSSASSHPTADDLARQRHAAEKAIDSIREKYGEDQIHYGLW